MTKTVAFIVESSSRKETAMAAKDFYRGPRSLWVNNIIDYMLTRNFNQENIYFLSPLKQEIIHFNGAVSPYSKTSKKLKTKDYNFLAEKVLEFVRREGYSSIEFHTGKNVANPIIDLLKGDDIQFTVFAANAALGQKHLYYSNLIQEENDKRLVREIKREKLEYLNHFQSRSADEVRKVLSELETKSSVFNIKENVQEISELLKKHDEQKRASVRSFNDFLNSLETQNHGLLNFIKEVKSLSAIGRDPSTYEKMKSKHGKQVAKYTRYLIKEEYTKRTANLLDAAVMRMQINLLT
jgi:hypothetical protein